MSFNITSLVIFVVVLIILYPVIRRFIRLLSYSLDKGIDSSSRASYVGNEYINNKLALKLTEIKKSSSDIDKDVWKDFEKEYKKY